MENKLQQLTQKLYDEGLEKGRAEAERLVAEAKTNAAKIVKEAEAQAAKILAEANTKAQDVEKNAMTEISLAGKQALSKIKAEISSMIIAKSTAPAVKAATLDPEFVKQMLLTVAKNWSGADSSKNQLKALLPEADFFGEEGQHDTLTSPWTFIVDPIDGTTNFVRGIPQSAISVALAHDGQVEYGHLEPKACLNLMRSLCKGRSEYDPKLCAAYNKATRNGKDMRHASAMLEAAVGSLFGNGLSTFLDPGVQGLDDFELVCFLVVQGKEA